MCKSHSRERSHDSFKRKPQNRVTKAILIVGEGHTESIYFEHLRREFQLRLVEVEIEGKDDASAPISVVNKAIELYEARRHEVKKAAKDSDSLWNKPPFDEVWSVFDKERPGHNSTFDEAVQKSQAHKFYLALSNPAFEYWFLLHIKDTTRSFSNADEVIKELNTSIHEFNKKLSKRVTPIPKYGKGDVGFIRDLLPKFVQAIFPQLNQALSRAAPTMPEVTSNNPPNPSTGVGKLVETMKAMKRP